MDTARAVMVVDRTERLSGMRQALGQLYYVQTVRATDEMYALMALRRPDLIILDTATVDAQRTITGLRIMEDYCQIPVIVLVDSMSSEAEWLELGAVDCVGRPINFAALLQRVGIHLRYAAYPHRIQELQQNAIVTMYKLMGIRDETTGKHIVRTREFMLVLLKAMMRKGLYAKEMSGWDPVEVADASLLHDIGKIGISDLILNKPDHLTTEEFDVIKQHPTKGTTIIDLLLKSHGLERKTMLQAAYRIAGFHHEKVNGMGYPHGVRLDDIPLEARAAALADVYDALTSDRPYRPGMTHEEAFQIIAKGNGSQFDPRLCDLFLGLGPALQEVASAFAA